MSRSCSTLLPVRLKVIINNDQEISKEDTGKRLSDATVTGYEVFENFVRKLEKSLRVQREYVILDSLWEKTKEKFNNTRDNQAMMEQLGSMGDEFGDVSTSV